MTVTNNCLFCRRHCSSIYQFSLTRVLSPIHFWSGIFDLISIIPLMYFWPLLHLHWCFLGVILLHSCVFLLFLCRLDKQSLVFPCLFGVSFILRVALLFLSTLWIEDHEDHEDHEVLNQFITLHIVILLPIAVAYIIYLSSWIISQRLRYQEVH